MKGLLVVDAQWDFISLGLPVPGAYEAVKVIADKVLSDDYGLIVASRDWHPADHCSFKENGGEWPRHCVARTPGAFLISSVTKNADYIVSKGTDPQKEEYGAWPRARRAFMVYRDKHALDGIEVCGLATDYCVKATLEQMYADRALNDVRITVDPAAVAGIDAGASALVLDRVAAR